MALHWKLVYFAQKVFSTLPPPLNKWQVLGTKCRFAITGPSLPSARTSCGQVVDKKWPGDVIKKTHTLWSCADYCYSSPLAIVSDHLCSLYNASMTKTGVHLESRKEEGDHHGFCAINMPPSWQSVHCCQLDVWSVEEQFREREVYFSLNGTTNVKQRGRKWDFFKSTPLIKCSQCWVQQHEGHKTVLWKVFCFIIKPQRYRQ